MEFTYEQVMFSFLYVALMLVFLLGDVLRTFAGDFKPGEMAGMKVSSNMWLVAAIMMVIPIVMIVLNILIPHSFMKWVNIIVSFLFFLMNLSGIKGYKIYDQFLLVVSFIINFIIIYLAFTLY